jgi:hypothetical protein
MGRIHEAVDPFRTYHVQMPDGRVWRVDGADLIRTGQAAADLVRAIRTGDDRIIQVAMERLERTLD